jgi:alpha-mannosidase
MEQEIWLHRARVEFRTRILWREKHKLLKVCFPASLHTTTSMHEIQFGFIRRPTHRTTQRDRDQYEVCQQKWSALAEENGGVALLNDCKYGISTFENSLDLTLLRSSMAPDDLADQGEQEFTYALCAWEGPFMQSGVVHEAYDLNTPVPICAGTNAQASLIKLDHPGIILETVKLAEDNSGDLILRLYESSHSTTRCQLTTSLPVRSVHEADMLETRQTELLIANGIVELHFRPFEIKTLRLSLELSRL